MGRLPLASLIATTEVLDHRWKMPLVVLVMIGNLIVRPDYCLFLFSSLMYHNSLLLTSPALRCSLYYRYFYARCCLQGFLRPRNA